MTCSHTTTCELFVQFAMNPALDVWKSHFCEADFNRCARFQTAKTGRAVPITLLPNGKNVEVKRSSTEMGATALFNSILKNRARMVSALLRTGIDVNTRGVTGETPLMAAAEAGSEETARLLLERGADPTITDMDGDTAYDIAVRKGNDAVAALLKGGRSKGGQ
jgi:ankyrin repeat protein